MNVLVTGGGGFLGLAIVRRLVERGDRVRSFSRNSHPDLEAIGVEQLQGDLGDADSVASASAGCDLVFHVAAKAGIWGPLEEYRRVNVGGTDHVLAACRRHGVRRLVYTSSPSVVFTGEDHENLDESAPYATHFLAHYPRTKAEAERKVLAANGADLATVALRPHLIWGPGDNHLIPRLIARARTGKLRIIGDGKNVVDAIYVDNAADAHLAAADRLQPGSHIGGKSYFLAQGEPLPLWELVNRILVAAGAAPVTRRMPAGLAYAVGAALEAVHGLFGLSGEPRMTRFVARQLSTSHWFNLDAARRDLDFAPRVGVEEGLRRLAAAYASPRTNAGGAHASMPVKSERLES